MNRFPDIAEWYTDERAQAEDVQWCLTQSYRRHLAFILPRMELAKVETVIEFGSGAGHVASGLPPSIRYCGVEKNRWFFDKSRRLELENCTFYPGDVRTFKPANVLDLSMAWFFLKTFALNEIDSICGKILAAGRYGAFNIQLANHDFDNGSEYPHSYITEARLEKMVAAARHKIVDREVQEEAEVEGHGRMRDVALWTKRTE